MSTSLTTRPGQGLSATVYASRNLTGYTTVVELSSTGKFSNVTTKTPTVAGRQVKFTLSPSEVDSLKDCHYRVKATKDGATVTVESGTIDYVPSTAVDLEKSIPARLSDVALRAAFDGWAGKPGMELGFTEIRTGVNLTTGPAVNVPVDLSIYGMQITVDPIARPYLVRADALIGHSVAAGVVALRIAEVSNGVDPVLNRADFQEVPGGAGPFYAWCRPKLRVPPSVRARTFRLQWFITTSGTGTLYVPGTDTSQPAANSTWALEMQAVTL